MTQSSDNTIFVASAGSGKTTFLVKETLSRSDKRIAILTYTNNNINEIKNKFYTEQGGIPRNVDVCSWFTFLLRECARPYQRSVYSKQRVRTINFPKGRSARGIPYSRTECYYFANGDEIYADKLPRFVLDCETHSKGLVTKRLADIYDEIFIDEFQDLAGYDLDLLEVLLKTRLRVVAVGDPRQCTYTTNNSARNSQYRGTAVMDLARRWKADGLCQIDDTHAKSYRCNQEICDFADRLWPDMKKMESLNTTVTGHDGVFLVPTNRLHEYVRVFSPVILRYNRTASTYGYDALNFGDAKGLEFDRVLIVPHGPIKKYLRSGNPEDVAKSKEKFYVAVTRARYSVAFLCEEAGGCLGTEWSPSAG